MWWFGKQKSWKEKKVFFLSFSETYVEIDLMTVNLRRNCFNDRCFDELEFVREGTFLMELKYIQTMKKLTRSWT